MTVFDEQQTVDVNPLQPLLDAQRKQTASMKQACNHVKAALVDEAKTVADMMRPLMDGSFFMQQIGKELQGVEFTPQGFDFLEITGEGQEEESILSLAAGDDSDGSDDDYFGDDYTEGK